jgi:CubicO group peptidase (beta-lactamase class C family)
MTARRKRITRRAALAGLGGLAAATQVIDVAGVRTMGEAQAQQRMPQFDLPVPVKGQAGPGLEPFDTAMLQIMDRHGVPGAALAVAKGGKLVLAKGYGWANVSSGIAVQPDTLFGLASISKPFTAVATLKLVEQGKLGLDEPVFDNLKHIRPPTGARVDPRLRRITVRQCLDHSVVGDGSVGLRGSSWPRNMRGGPEAWGWSDER